MTTPTERTRSTERAETMTAEQKSMAFGDWMIEVLQGKHDLGSMEGALREAWKRGRAEGVERCALIVAGNYGWVNGTYYDDLADAVRGLPAPDGEGPPIPRMADGSPADPHQYGVVAVTPREPAPGLSPLDYRPVAVTSDYQPPPPTPDLTMTITADMGANLHAEREMALMPGDVFRCYKVEK